jgi:hypothetical protein
MYEIVFMLLRALRFTEINPLPVLTHSSVLDLNVACRAKRTKTYWQVHIFKCPLKKTQPSCPGSRDLNWTGKGLRHANRLKSWVGYIPHDSLVRPKHVAGEL